MKDKVYRLLEVKKKIQLGGGEVEIEKHHKTGRLTARERLDLLFDKNSFIEIGGHRSGVSYIREDNSPEDGVVTGYGTVHGRLVFAYAQDSTIKGGSLGRIHGNKITHIQEMALKMGGPIIAIMDSAGARLEEGLEALSEYGKIFHRKTISSGVIPQISLVMGPTAGTAAFFPSLSDFVFMVDKTSSIFTSGPKIIKSKSEEEITEEELGGARIHSEITGLAHFIDESEEKSLNRVRSLLSYLPSNNLDDLPIYEVEDDINRVEEKLNKIIPKNKEESYDMKKIIKTLADQGKIFEIQEYFAENIISAFIRLGGKTIGVLANQPKVLSGKLDKDALNKGANFIRTCNSFNIPLLNLVDFGGFVGELSEEHGGIMKYGAKMIHAYGEATVAKVTLIIGKAYGGGYIIMGSKEVGSDQVFAWPSAEISIMPAEGAANILYKNDIKNSDDPIKTRKEKIKEYREGVSSPYVAAEKGYVDDIIFPSTSRPRLISAFDMLASKRESGPSKKHSSLPL